jgi:protein phosphatase
MLLKSDSLSDIGRYRTRNEDYCYSNPQRGVFIIADGMGGHPAGDIASRLAVETLQKTLEVREAFAKPEEIPQRLEHAFQLTNQVVISAGRSNSQWHNMGTTASIIIASEGRAFTTNIGDSRIYLLQNGSLRQCSKDHNPTGPALFDGKIQRFSNILTQAIGLDQPLDLYQQQLLLQSGDRLLLCTDGLNNMLSDSEIRRILIQSDPPGETCEQLVRQANNQGGHDNISVIVVDILDCEEGRTA